MVLPYIYMNLPRVYTCSPSSTPLPSDPSGSSQCTRPEHLVSCIEPGLAIRFTCDNLHVSMPFSQIILPSPFSTESKRLFNISVSLLLSCIQGYCYHLYKFHIYALVYCIGIFLMNIFLQSFGTLLSVTWCSVSSLLLFSEPIRSYLSTLLEFSWTLSLGASFQMYKVADISAL